MIRIYTETNHYHASFRNELIDLLKPFVGKGMDFSIVESLKIYGISINDYTLVTEPGDADIAVLPMSWNYYYTHGLKKKAWDFVDRATASNKKVITWTSGDFGITPKNNSSVYVFRHGGYRNKLPTQHMALPVFINDPIAQFFDGNEQFVLQSYLGNGNTIGFCGHANGTFSKRVKELLLITCRNILFALKLSPLDPQTFVSSAALRFRLLRSLERNNSIRCNFLMRDKYRAGARTNEERERSTLAYFDNILNSDFVLCVRGGGNFSVRFYECLAMGRIPILYDTDTPLPEISPLEWKDYIVQITEGQLPRVHEEIGKFMANKDMFEQRMKNRKVFLYCMTRKYFWEKSIATILCKS